MSGGGAGERGTTQHGTQPGTRDRTRPKTRHGALSRLGIGTQVTLTSLLALIAVLLVNYLAGRPGIRKRFDLTGTGQNTLSTATLGVLDRLPGDVTLDVFYRPDEIELLQGVVHIAYQRTARLLGSLREWSAGRIDVHYNDVSDPAAVEARLRELKLTGFENCVVVSYGERREVLRLKGDLAVFDLGARPPDDFRPPRLVQFDGERAIVEAILQVTLGEVQEIYFSTGQGERAIFGESDEDMDRLAGLLADEGLRVNRWSPVEDGAVPEDCACLSIVRPTDQFTDEALDAVEAYVLGGGRLVVAPAADDSELARSRLGELLERFGIEVQNGIVCQPHVDPHSGQVTVGVRRVTAFPIHPDDMTAHPVVDPIRGDRRTFLVSGAKPLRVTRQPKAGVSSPLFTSQLQAWVDAFPMNLQPDPLEAAGRKFALAVASDFRPEGAQIPAALEQEPRARIVTLGSSWIFTNYLFDSTRDLLRNAYNWALDREYRLSISPHNPDLRLIPEDRLSALPRINQFAWGWLPGICLAAGVITALARSRGGPPPRSRHSEPSP